MTSHPFLLTALRRPGRRPLVPALVPWLLGLRTYRRLYGADTASDVPFEERALAALGVRVSTGGEGLTTIPTEGPLVVVANHPHGVLDGLVMGALVRKIRPDVRILTNLWLSGIRELADLCFFVDVFDGPSAAMRSRTGLRAARAWLAGGGSLIAFPAGEVAHTTGPGHTHSDSPWHTTAARLAIASGAPVVPAFISGRNSRLFYAAGRLHPMLRTLLLSRELHRKQNEIVQVRLGAPVVEHRRSTSIDGSATTQLLREAVEALDVSRPRPTSDVATLPIAATAKRMTVVDEVQRLPSTACLVDAGDYRVFFAAASEIPATLREIGRLREISYREVGEGTGRALDVDRFDTCYLHLFLWDRRRQEIVGAYRMGRSDEIVTRHGVRGLYVRTLFSFERPFIGQLGAALELGRAFVRPEYQKRSNALALLWKGIAQFVVRHPQYRVLYGCVSISRDYTDASRQLMVRYLREHHLHRALAPCVTARQPFTIDPAIGAAADADHLETLVSAQEADGKGMPVLLRHYLKLNAKLLAVNVDRAFADALDLFMVVNLDDVAPAVRRRFFGRADLPVMQRLSA